MIVRAITLRRLALSLVAICAAIFLLAPAVRADDLNSQHDLCTGANLSIQAKDAGCGKVKTKDANGNDIFVDEKDHTALKAESKLTNLLNQIINIISIIAGIAAVFMVIYGGFQFLTSSGNPEKTKSARNAILYALGGLLIVAFAQVVVKFVINKIAG